MDVSQYLGVFLDEAKEHIQSLNDNIMQLEQEPENEDCINEIFRAAHSLKGMAGTMGYKRMQQLTHDMEDVFSDVRAGTIKVGSSMIDTLFQCLDAIQSYVDIISETQDEGTEDNANLIKALADIRNVTGSTPAENGKPADGNENTADTVADSKDAWKDIVIESSAKSTLQAAAESGKNVFGITIHISKDCILKAARAFLVYKNLEDVGEIIVADPSTQDIEDEKFDLSFSVVMISDNTMDKVSNAASSVSEIEAVDIGNFDIENAKVTGEEKKAAEPIVANEVTGVAPDKPEIHKNDKSVQTSKKAAIKPVVNRTVRVDIDKLDVLMNLVSELIIAKNSLISATATASDTGNDINEQIEYLESVTTNLHESVMKVRMVPIESVLQKFPRMIRDFNKALGKKMELTMSGEETEMDRTVVDEIGDPLMHLLRNSADHGIETAEVRAQRGKPAVGKIFLNAYQDGNSVVIEVGDDGNGIDAEAVKRKAIEKGIVSEEQANLMTEKQCVELLFHPGFSTSDKVSEISGRGVGLDVVKSKVESLSGEVAVKTKLGVGSTWTIRLPLTLAIIQALMVIVGNEKYAIPLDSIQSIENIAPSEVKLVGNTEVINLRGNVTRLIRMNKELEIESSSMGSDLVVVIVKKGEQLVGLVIDELMGQQEIVIKPLGKYINKCKFISGATILGNGEIALILDPNALV